MKSINQYINEALKVKAKGPDVYFVNNNQDLADFLPSRYDKKTGILNLESLSFIHAELEPNMPHRIFAPINKFIINNNIKYINVSDWEFGKVKSLYNLFNGCYHLEEIIGLGSWDTSNIEDFGGLFAYCNNIKDLSGIQKWDVSKSKRFRQMFYRCQNLQSIDLSNWIVSNNMMLISEMFCGCIRLTTINGIEKWDVSNCRDFSGLFSGCKNLKSLDLSKWKIHPTYTQRMFNGCTTLTTIGDVDKWDLSQVIDCTDMFMSCENLNLDMSMVPIYIGVIKVRMFKNANKKIKKPKFK